MTPDLRDALRHCLRGRVCFLGLGNPDLADDGFGVRLAEALDGITGVTVIAAGVTPERHIERIAREEFDNVVFLDAVDAGAPPGSVVLLGSGDLVGRFPQISTHKFSLGTLASLIRMRSRAAVWLLGVQPASLRGTGLSSTLDASRRALQVLICDALRADLAGATGSSPR